MPRSNLEPTSYENVKCLACGETIRRPGWVHSRSGGYVTDFVGKSKRRFDFQKKRAVKVRTMNWAGYGNGHWHTDLEAEENTFVAVLFDPPYIAEPTVYEVHPRDADKAGMNKIWKNVGVEFLSRREALTAALEVYRKEFGCEAHYLVTDYFSEERTKKTLEEIRRRTREGD